MLRTRRHAATGRDIAIRLSIVKVFAVTLQLTPALHC